MEVKYQSIKIEDLNEVKSFLESRHLIPEAEAKMLDGYLKKNSETSVKAIVDNKIVGITLVGFDGIKGQIYKLVVDEEYRSHGIGRALILEAIDRLKLLKAVEISINCRPILIKWYESQGFQKIESTHYARPIEGELSNFC